MLVPRLAVYSVGLSFLLHGCGDFSRKSQSVSEVDGFGAVLDAIPPPRTWTEVELRTFVKTVAVGPRGIRSVSAPSLRGPEILKQQLYKTIVSTGGLPRWQLTDVLEDLLADTSRYCENVSCARIFGVKSRDVPKYLDGLYQDVTQSSTLRSPERKAALTALVGSLRPKDARGPSSVAARGGIESASRFLWDNWFVHFKQTYYRFSLEAPRVFPEGFRATFADDFSYPLGEKLAGRKAQPDDRHHMAQIGLYTSKNGRQWSYQGVAIGTSKNPKAWDSHVIWSGNAHDVGGRLVVPYTGRSKTLDPVTKDKWLQKIGIAVLDERTGAFKKMGTMPVLDPTAKDARGQIIARTLGYDISSDPLVIMAWRDPYLYVDKARGEVHMFFAAKIDQTLLEQRLGRASGNGAIGHAVAKLTDLGQWELKPPLKVPAAYSQFELPIVIQRNGEYVLFSSVVELGSDTRKQSLRAYRSATLDGDWQKIRPESDKVMELNKIYGVNIALGANGKDYYGVSFDDQKLTLSPLMKLNWDERGVPRFPSEENW